MFNQAKGGQAGTREKQAKAADKDDGAAGTHATALGIDDRTCE